MQIDSLAGDQLIPLEESKLWLYLSLGRSYWNISCPIAIKHLCQYPQPQVNYHSQIPEWTVGKIRRSTYSSGQLTVDS